MAHYLDASVLVTLFAAEPMSGTVPQALSADPGPLMVSDFGAGEVAAAVSRKLRTGDFRAGRARAMLLTFDAWVADVSTWVESCPDDMKRATALVRRFELKLRFPDALHLALCEHESTRLATRDRTMADAADALGLPLLRLA